MADPVVQVTLDQVTSRLQKDAMADPLGPKGKLLSRLMDQYPDGIPRQAVYDELAKTDKSFASTVKIIPDDVPEERPGTSLLGTPLLERAIPNVRAGISAVAETVAPYMRLHFTNDEQFKKNAREFDTGFYEGMGGTAVDLTSPANLGIAAASFLTPAGWAQKGGRVARLAKNAVKYGFTAQMLKEAAADLPEAYDAYLAGDMRTAGKKMAAGLAEAGFGVQSARHLKAKAKQAGAPTVETTVAPKPAVVEAPAPRATTAEVDLYRNPKTGVQRSLRQAPESEIQKMLRLNPEELAAQRTLAAEQLAALERSAASQSQGTWKRGMEARTPEDSLDPTLGGGPLIPAELRQQLGAARAKVQMLDRIMGRQSPGGLPPEIRPEPVSQDFPPAARALSTPEEIAMRHNLPVTGPMPPRTGSTAPQGTFNLNEIWRETPAQIQARQTALAHERSAYGDRTSPEAVNLERQISALQDMLKAKRTAEIGGQPVPPVGPVSGGPTSASIPPQSMGGQVPAVYQPPASGGVPPAAMTGTSVPPPPRPLLQPTAGVIVEPGAQTRYSGPTSESMRPPTRAEAEMYTPQGAPPPVRTPEAIPAARPDSTLSPSGTSRVDMKKLAEKHNVKIEALRQVESTPDVEVVGLINRLTNMRAKGLDPQGNPLPDAVKAKMDSLIQAYTELLRGRDPVYRDFVKNPSR